jgi:putative two-component system response regulator
VVETRNRETGNHVKRVAEYSAVLGEGAGLTREQVAILRFASPMHDLGKMSIPDHVLNKQGPLTPEEFAMMQAHTTVGHEMLRHSTRELLQAAAIVALQHHEKYDGSGYPQGLSRRRHPCLRPCHRDCGCL